MSGKSMPVGPEYVKPFIHGFLQDPHIYLKILNIWNKENTWYSTIAHPPCHMPHFSLCCHRLDIPTRSPTQLDIVNLWLPQKISKHYTGSAFRLTAWTSFRNCMNWPASDTGATELNLVQTALEYWPPECFFEAEMASKYPGVRATRTGQIGGLPSKIRLGRLTLPFASHKLRPRSRSYMDFMTSMYAQMLALPVLLGWKQSYVKTVIGWPDETDGRLEGWPQLLATVHPEPSISVQPSLHDLAIMTVR